MEGAAEDLGGLTFNCLGAPSATASDVGVVDGDGAGSERGGVVGDGAGSEGGGVGAALLPKTEDQSTPAYRAGSL